MKRQGTAGEHEKVKKNNTKENMNKEKVNNKNKEVKKKPATTEEFNQGDTMEASTLEEWWEKTRAM
eukprot:16429486-Heterocapsa_arctica.AAC.1